MKLHNVFRKIAFGLAATLSISIMGMSASAYVVENPAAISTSIESPSETTEETIFWNQFEQITAYIEQVSTENVQSKVAVPSIHSETQYPEDFGGITVDNSTNKPVILVVQKNNYAPSLETSSLTNFAAQNKIATRPVKFSMNELNRGLDEIASKIENKTLPDFVSYAGRSTGRNRIGVGIVQMDDAKIQQVKNALVGIDLDMLIFEGVDAHEEHLDPIEIEDVIAPRNFIGTLYPGNHVTVVTQTSYRGGSLGIGSCIYYDNNYNNGFFTTGHFLGAREEDDVRALRNNDAHRVGHIMRLINDPATGVDASFVDLYSPNVQISNSANGYNFYSYAYPVATRIAQVACQHTSSSGEITHEDTMVNIGGTYWYHMAKCAITLQSGDSGGLVHDGSRAIGIVVTAQGTFSTMPRILDAMNGEIGHR